MALFTVRDQMKLDPAGTLRSIAALGYRCVETALWPSLGPAVRDAGLEQRSAYAPTYLVTGNRSAWGADVLPEEFTWAKAVDEAKARGLEYLVIVYLQRSERGGLETYRDLARRLARAGETCQKAGLGLAYHAHSFEYQAIDGTRPIDVLLGETPKELLGLELDTFWAIAGGADPIDMLRAHSGRVPLVHLKDPARGLAVEYDESKVPPEAFREIGRGSIDWPAFLAAADAANVRYFYVEQDHCRGNPLDSLRQSHETIERISL